MITIRKNELPEDLNRFPVVLYGAGFAGRECKKILDKVAIKVNLFVDDDATKWGKSIDGLEVYSYDQLLTYCKGKEKVNVILTSIYGVQISKKLEKICNIFIYEMYDWYTEVVMPDRFGNEIYGTAAIREYKKNIQDLKGYLQDEESYQVLLNLYQYMKTGNIQYISEISTEQEQYFIKEVLEYFGNHEISIVDAGAYEGELIRAIDELNINVKKWFCFETNAQNYEQLLKNSVENRFKGKQICVNKGLWNQNMVLHVQGDGTGSKVVTGISTENTVEMVTIDEYFKNICIDLIKMDIEGAEMNALRGGMEVIKRDRPVLAISIYHSIEDYYEIMKMLLHCLEKYKYYIRHHSMVFCETVLYAIPIEGRNI